MAGFTPTPVTPMNKQCLISIVVVFIAAGVTAMYRRGREAGKDWLGQGVRFGLWFAVAACVPGFLIYYAVQPTGLMVAVKQIVFGGIATELLGMVVAGLNKQAA